MQNFGQIGDVELELVGELSDGGNFAGFESPVQACARANARNIVSWTGDSELGNSLSGARITFLPRLCLMMSGTFNDTVWLPESGDTIKIISVHVFRNVCFLNIFLLL